MSASVKIDGNFELYTTLALKYANKKSENIPAFFSTEKCNICILCLSSNISSQVARENENKGCLFDLFSILVV